MKIIAESLLRAMPGVAHETSGSLDIKAWMLRESFHLRTLSSGKRSVLYEASPDDISSSFRHDACLVAGSSVESFVETRQKRRDERALAWMMVKSYYSAYFAAHALMRFFGYASVWGERSQVSAIRRVSMAWLGSVGDCPERGLWRVRMLHASGSIEIESISGGNGGSHEGFWNYFSVFLSELSQKLAVANSVVASDAQFAILRVDALRAYVDSGRFVKCRHEINYRRGYGVWYPFVGFDPSSAQLSSLMSSRLNGADAEAPLSFDDKNELDAAVVATRVLVSLLLEIVVEIAKNFPREASDLRAGPLRLCKQFKVI